jgi:hypothetical protein
MRFAQHHSSLLVEQPPTLYQTFFLLLLTVTHSSLTKKQERLLAGLKHVYVTRLTNQPAQVKQQSTRKDYGAGVKHRGITVLGKSMPIPQKDRTTGSIPARA